MGYQRRQSYYKPYQKAAPVPAGDRPRVKNPSEFQTAILAAVEVAGEKILLNFRTGVTKVVGIHVKALAGCGKTTIMTEKDYYLPEQLRNDSVSVAFNSDISKVLENRVAPGVEAKTIHALGRAALVVAFPKLKSRDALDNRKYMGYIQAHLGNESDTMVARENLRLMMDRARDQLAWTPEEMEPIFEQFAMESGHLVVREFLVLAAKILNQAIRDTSRMDFGDMIAMPIYHNLPLRRYSVVSVDEYQDLCPSQHELLDRSVKPGGLMFTVGDENQAIYLWRGADSESIARGCARYDSQVFPLPRTYRCGSKIVASANRYVPELICPDTAHEGEVIEDQPISKMMEEIRIGSFLLSRLNAPLLKLCFQLVRQGTPANIKGRDVGENLKFMIKRSKADTVEGLLSWVDAWCASEVERREAKNKSTEVITDTAEMIHILCEGRYTIPDVHAAIEQAFPSKLPENIVLLSSIHKSKGLEARDVYILVDTLFLKKGNPREEQNLAYVADTRASHKLVHVKGR